MSTKPLSRSAKKVQQALSVFDLSLHVVELPESTRTSPEAARAVGCQVGQIAKSLVFKTMHTKCPILVIASGSNRVNEQLLEELVGEAVSIASADFVRQSTGFVIGGVPPMGHDQPVETFIDRDLLQYDWIWAAAGTPRAVFQLTPDDLVRITKAKIVDISQ